MSARGIYFNGLLNGPPAINDDLALLTLSCDSPTLAHLFCFLSISAIMVYIAFLHQKQQT
jgi:hypothetical protein